MSRIKEDKIREDRITKEIVVDTYCEEERAMVFLKSEKKEWHEMRKEGKKLY
ncbi:MAG: hypothetical protein AB1480_16140 [Nitrospirota bacterium]